MGSGSTPGMRFSSGLIICDEELRNGHWVNRYWDATGQIKPEVHMPPGGGDMRDAFQLRIAGKDLDGTWQWRNATQERVHDPDGLLITVELASTARPVTVKLHTLLYGGAVMVRWLDITNAGSEPIAITHVSPWAGRIWNASDVHERLPAASPAPFEVATTQLWDQWGVEGAWAFDTLTTGTKSLVSLTGKSGWGHPTFFAHNRATGEWAVASLAWSANWAMHLSGQDDQLTFTLGPAAGDSVLRVIDPGETVRSPETHMLLMRGTLDQVIQALHQHVRREVMLPPVPGRGYQVEANHRGYIVDHEDEPGMKREIDMAHAVGAEMFVIDAGWYGPEPNDWGDNVGDWYAGKWLPHDLQPIIAYAHQNGLLFGLWAEIEAIGASSNLLKQHPDWVTKRNGEPVAGGRELDFANPVVATWAEAQIASMIQRYNLDMYRIDYNNAAGLGGNRQYKGFVENTEWRHVEALYAMFDHLHKRFPHVIFQNCSNGGGRLDYGIMHRFHNTEISDWMRMPRGLKILNGVTWVLPPEILLRTFGTEVGGLEEEGDLDSQLRMVMMSRPIFRGLSPSLAEMNPLFEQKVRNGVTLFKQTMRPIMVNSRVYHHTPVLPLTTASPWVVLEYATPRGDKDVVGVFRTSVTDDPVYHLMPRGLDFSKTYRVHFENSGQVIEVSGAQLRLTGIPIRVEESLASELVIFEAK